MMQWAEWQPHGICTRMNASCPPLTRGPIWGSSGTSLSGSSHPMAVKHVSLSLLTPREMLAFSLASQVQLLLPSQLSEVCPGGGEEFMGFQVSSCLKGETCTVWFWMPFWTRRCSPVRMPVEAGWPCRSHLWTDCEESFGTGWEACGQRAICVLIWTWNGSAVRDLMPTAEMFRRQPWFIHHKRRIFRGSLGLGKSVFLLSALVFVHSIFREWRTKPTLPWESASLPHCISTPVAPAVPLYSDTQLNKQWKC